MNEHLTLSCHNVNKTLAAIANAQQFVKQGRPLTEVLSFIDQGLVSLHDARVEMARFREKVYIRHEEELAAASDPNCLEGPGRTPEQAAADWKALRAVAPTDAKTRPE